MYLKKTKNKSGRVYLSIMHGYRENGKSKAKTIKGLGYVDELRRQYNDPVEHFTQEVIKMEAARRARNAPATIRLSRTKRLSEIEKPRNLGFCALSKIYHSLKLNTFSLAYQRKINTKYNFNSAMQLLTYNRILYTQSDKNYSVELPRYFENFEPLDNNEIKNLPGDFAAVTKPLQAHLDKTITKLLGRNNEFAYLHLSNHYFDLKHKSSHFGKKDVSENLFARLAFLDDESLVPISFKVFLDTSMQGKLSTPEIIEKFHQQNYKRFIVVTDRNISDSEKLEMALNNADGYIHYLPLAATDDETSKWALSASGFSCSKDGCMLKSRLVTRQIPGNNGAEPKRITEKQVIFYSKQLALYDTERKIHAIDHIIRINEFLNPSFQGVSKQPEDIVWAQELRTETEKILSLEDPSLEDDVLRMGNSATHGFYLLVTSETWKSDMKLKEVFEQHLELSRFAKSLSVEKPFYDSAALSTDIMRSQFLINYLAITLLCVLRKTIGCSCCLFDLIKALQEANCTHLEDDWWILDKTSDILETISNKCNFDLTHRYLQKDDIDKLLSESKKPLC